LSSGPARVTTRPGTEISNGHEPPDGAINPPLLAPLTADLLGKPGTTDVCRLVPKRGTHTHDPFQTE
jgi:hypothetical protein